MKISEISVLRRTRASADVLGTLAESINAGRFVRSIQTTIRRIKDYITVDA
jgi:hypothetical protein